MIVTAIDPGNIQSAYCVMDTQDCRPLRFGKIPNEQLAEDLNSGKHEGHDVFIIERVACYGMPVGREVFDTCEWIGRFSQIIISRYGKTPEYILRMDVKRAICHDTRARDANIRRALIDRFARHDLKNGKGTKNNPDWFYGFKADIWAAYACAAAWVDMEAERQTNREE